MWCFAICFGALGLLIIIVGTKSFESLENIFAVMKISAIVLFIILAALALLGVFKTAAHGPKMPSDWLPTGWTGLWAGLIFAFYGYGGLEVMGLMATRLEEPEKAPKAGKIMLLLLGSVYVLSIGLSLLLEPWESFHAKKSPFVMALSDYKLVFVLHQPAWRQYRSAMHEENRCECPVRFAPH